MLLAALPTWTDWLALVLQAGTFVALVIYVAKTWQMASATRDAAKASSDAYREAVEARKEALAPRVLLYISPEISLFKLVVENAGRGTAADVTFTFRPALATTHPRLKPVFFDSPQATLPPGYKLAHIVDSWPEYLKSDLPRRYDVTVAYRGIESGTSHSVSYVIDTEAFRHLYVNTRKDIHDVAETLGSLKASVEKASTGILHLLQDAHADAVLNRTVLPRSPPTIVTDLVTGWDLFLEAAQQEPSFVDKQPIVRRMRPMTVRLLDEMASCGYGMPEKGLASRLVLLFLDEREADFMTPPWQAAVTQNLQALAAAVRVAGPTREPDEA